MNALKKLREERGLSKYALAKKAGVVKSTLINIEQEKYNIKQAKYETLERIANALGVSIDELVNETAD